MAFDPDMSGVCSVGGTLVMISMPTKIASTKTVSSMTRSLMTAHPLAGRLLWPRGPSVGPPSRPLQPGAGGDLVVEIHLQGALAHEVEQEGGDVLCVELACVMGDHGREIEGAEHGDPR